MGQLETKTHNKNCMKIKTAFSLLLTAGLLAGCMTEKDEAEHAPKKDPKQAKLMEQAKVSKEDAQKIALTKIPNGTIKEGELEKEHGKLQWSFDITTPDSKDVMEVNIDAITGEVISVGKD